MKSMFSPPVVFREAERLIQKHKIDFIDCFQIVTILPRSIPILVFGIQVNTDHHCGSRLGAGPPGEEGARVWEVTTEPAPI